MKKTIILLTLFVITISLFGTQTDDEKIYLELYGKDICGNIKKLDIYVLKNDSIAVYSYDTIPIEVPCLGRYRLITSYITRDDTVHLEITSPGINRDTILIESIYEVIALLHGSGTLGWKCCGQPCDGYYVEYLNNGNKSYQGYFEEGKPIGEHRSYFSNGELFYIAIYNKKGKRISYKTFRESSDRETEKEQE